MKFKLEEGKINIKLKWGDVEMGRCGNGSMEDWGK